MAGRGRKGRMAELCTGLSLVFALFMVASGRI
jgi:hypothetical protein